MKLETLFQHCSEVVKIITKSSLPPDELLSKYLRSKKYIGSKERKIISEIVFMHLRFLGFSDFLLVKLIKNKNSLTINNSLHLSILLSLNINMLLYPENLLPLAKSIEKLYNCSNGFEYLQNYIIDQFDKNFNNEEINKLILEIDSQSKDIVKNLPKINNEEIKILAARYSIPFFILQSWFNYYFYKGINPLDVSESLLFPSNFTIRINNRNYTREEIISKLRKDGILPLNTNFSPYGITFHERVNLLQHPLYKNGIIDIQDEGSQLICLACNPRKTDKILDACAGAGGKSLFLAFLQNDQGTIVANDINILKLKELQKRAMRAGFKSISINLMKTSSKTNYKLKENYFDIVLVDAPCSGIGTARRNPMHKWNLTMEKLDKISRKQRELLLFYSRYVKQGGTLIYATCSLMPEENNFITEWFLDKNRSFLPEPLAPAFTLQNITLPMLDETTSEITLFPNIHKTDGFYIAKFRKAT